MPETTLYAIHLQYQRGSETGVQIKVSRELFRSREEANHNAVLMYAKVSREEGMLSNVRIEFPEFAIDLDSRPSEDLDAIDRILAESEESNPHVPAIPGKNPEVTGAGEGDMRRTLETYTGERVKGFDYGQRHFAVHFHNGGFIQVRIAPDGSNLQVEWPNNIPGIVDTNAQVM